jgi:peptide-methionine (S)-S-oxide reductase
MKALRWAWTLAALWAVAVGAQPIAGAPPRTETAIFAGGCFWCVEADFDKGYIGGRVPNPTYGAVSAGGTGHTEAVKIVFDPARISYAQLLEKFWPTIDPTVKDQQFCDVGSQYRSGIFALDQKQLKEAEASKAARQKAKPFKAPIVTEIALATTFYPAEEYHQDYYLKNPIRYRYYRTGCGRDTRLKDLWGRSPQ